MKIRFPNLFPYGIIGWASQILATIGLVWPSSEGLPSHNCGRPYGRLRFYGSLDPKLCVPHILGPWVQGLFGTYSSYTRLIVESKSRQWPCLGYCPYHKQGGGLWQIMISWQFGPGTFCTGILGLGVQGLFSTRSSYIPCCGMKNRVYCQVWISLVPTIEGVLLADYAFMAVWTPKCMYQPYWFCASKGYLVHIAHIPALLSNQNRVYGLVWDAVVPTNEGLPVADYDFMAVQTLYCMYRLYWICGSKGHLIHKANIPPAVELKVAYMAKCGQPSFPQTRASLWQIMILWQFEPCTVFTRHIGSVDPRVMWYIKLIYPLLLN